MRLCSNHCARVLKFQLTSTYLAAKKVDKVRSALTLALMYVCGEALSSTMCEGVPLQGLDRQSPLICHLKCTC